MDEIIGSDLSEICEQVRHAVRKGGEIVRDHWDKPRRVKHKGRIDLVTQTDLAVEKELLLRLKEILPQASFLAEETSGGNSLKETTWVVDPLDGTTNFAHGLPYVAISVALWRRGRVRLGAIFNPILEELFWAVDGQGAYLNEQRIHVSDAAELENSLAATGFPYDIRRHIRPVIDLMERSLLNFQGVRRFGAAALDLAHLACGRVDLFYEGWLKPWDTAAGWLIVEQAGGRVSRLDGGAYSLFSETILATNGVLHDKVGSLLGQES